MYQATNRVESKIVRMLQAAYAGNSGDRAGAKLIEVGGRVVELMRRESFEETATRLAADQAVGVWTVDGVDTLAYYAGRLTLLPRI